MKKQVDKSKLLTVSVIALLCLIFVVGFIYGLNSVLAMEGAYPPTQNEPSKTSAPTTPEEAVAYLNKVIKLAVEGKPKAEGSDEFLLVDDDPDKCIDIQGSEAVCAAARYVYKDVLELLTNDYNHNAPKAGYFKGIEGVLLCPDVKENEVAEVKCDYIKYVCPSCEEESDKPLDHCEACGGVHPYNEVWKDDYEITLIMKADAIAEKCFEKRSPAEIDALTAKTVADKMAISNTKVTYDELAIVFRVNRLTEKLHELTFRKVMTVKTDFSFIGAYAEVEGGSATIRLQELKKFTLTWPGLKLSADTKVIEPGSEDNLLATLTCDKPTEQTVKWTSSDASIVAVDDEGYFKAGKAKVAEGKSVTITASFTFGGRTYYDSCEVFVRYPVESVSLSKRKATMKAGESLKLSVKVSPKKATIQTVTWYSKNEAVAKVEPDGTIKAVAPGKTTVYCLSDDGYYRSSCEVTVK